MRDQKVGKLCAQVRKVNNFAAAGNEGLGPAEDFQIEWRQGYTDKDIFDGCHQLVTFPDLMLLENRMAYIK